MPTHKYMDMFCFELTFFNDNENVYGMYAIQTWAFHE